MDICTLTDDGIPRMGLRTFQATYPLKIFGQAFNIKITLASRVAYPMLAHGNYLLSVNLPSIKSIILFTGSKYGNTLSLSKSYKSS